MKRIKFEILKQDKSETVEGHGFSLEVCRKTIDFGIHKENGSYKTTELTSGRSCVYNADTLKEAISQQEEQIKRYGKQKFLKLVQQQPTIAEAIKEHQVEVKANHERKMLMQRLSTKFGFSLPICKYMLLAGKLTLDVVKFDDLLGTPSGTSTADYITQLYDKQTTELVKSLF